MTRHNQTASIALALFLAWAPSTASAQWNAKDLFPTDASYLPGGPACSNGLDDDGNGSTDFPQDPGCTGPADDFEFSYLPGDFFVTDFGEGRNLPGGAIWHVDAETGAATAIVRDEAVPTPVSVVVAGRTLLFTEIDTKSVFRFDLDSGALTRVSAGGLLLNPRGIAVRPDGTIVVADPTRDAVGVGFLI